MRRRPCQIALLRLTSGDQIGYLSDVSIGRLRPLPPNRYRWQAQGFHPSVYDELKKWRSGQLDKGWQTFKEEADQGMIKDRYSLSFKTGGLLYCESLKLAKMYLELGDWKSVRNQVITENLLQARTINTLKGLCREVLSRLKTLSPVEIEFLVQGNLQEQTYLLWLAVCRRHKFIADFAIEVLCERFLSLKTDLTRDDFDAFFNRKSEWHPELDRIKPTTRKKSQQVLFKILREANILTANNMIIAAMLSPKLLNVISQNNRRDVAYFPIVDFNRKVPSQ